MKKWTALLLTAVLALTLLAGCASTPSDTPATTAPATSAPDASSAATTAPDASSAATSAPDTELPKIVIGATPTPHAEILTFAAPLLAARGYDLEIHEFTDYVQPNEALDSGDLDANFFQHQPYLTDFNAEKGTKIVSIANIHYEPLGIYAGKTATLDALADGAKVAVPNDTTNEARALLLLEAQGLIKINPDAGLKATKTDIIENPKKLNIIEIEAAQLARSLPDVDIAVINGNYAMQAGLNAQTDALAKEEADSLAAETYANILAVREGDEDREDLKVLAEVLTSDEVRTFINDTYAGSVVPSK